MGFHTDITCSWFWDELNSRERRTGAIPTTLDQLGAKIIFEWTNLPKNYAQCYVTSVRHRCLVVVKSARDTRY